MPANPKFYPVDFDQQIVQGGELTLEQAIAQLRAEAVRVAIQQANTRRISGQQEIENQNRALSVTSPVLMPIFFVGPTINITQTITGYPPPPPPATPPPPPPPTSPISFPPVSQPSPLPVQFQGTYGFFYSGRNYEKLEVNTFEELQFSGDSLRKTGSRLSEIRNFCGTLSRNNTGDIFGGFNRGREIRTDIADRFNFNTRRVRRLGKNLTTGAAGLQGGISNLNKGLLCGGVEVGKDASRRVQRVPIAFENPTITNRGNLLNTGRFNSRNGSCNRTTGWVFGGVNQSWIRTPLTSIESVNYTSDAEAFSNVGVVMSHGHYMGGIGGNADQTYLFGGTNTPASSWSYYSQTISAFNHNAATFVTIGATLPNVGRTLLACTSSGSAVYTIGGDTPETGAQPGEKWYEKWAGTKRIHKMTPNGGPGEFVRRLGQTLSIPHTCHNTVSDFGGGIS